MRQAVLLGNPGTRRTDYLQRALAQAGVSVRFWDWRDFDLRGGAGERTEHGEWFLKIDPPRWESCALGELDGLTGDYRAALASLSARARQEKITFWNHPQAIAALLDKRLCKETLQSAGIPVTALLHTERMRSADALFEAMREKRIGQVFIKPVYGSGAAGVSALRWQQASGRMALYTCACRTAEQGLVNTGRLRCFRDPADVVAMLEELLQVDCIIERWYAKAEHNGYSYDLRVVLQDGQADYILARLSRGPITNLQLNNHPEDAVKLGLSEDLWENIIRMCRAAADRFPGLTGAGIDVLLEKGSLRPRILEMNAQGDLIYQDIFRENRIYRRQAEYIGKWLDGGGKSDGNGTETDDGRHSGAGNTAGVCGYSGAGNRERGAAASVCSSRQAAGDFGGYGTGCGPL